MHQSFSCLGGCLACSPKLPGRQPRSAFKGFEISLSFAIRWQPSRRCAGCHHLLTPLFFVSLGLPSLCFCGNHAHNDLQALFFLHLMNLKHIFFSPAPRSGSDPVRLLCKQWGLTGDREYHTTLSARCFPKRFAGTLTESH